MTAGSRPWVLPQRWSGPTGEVAWVRLGPPAGVPLVLLHGTPFSSYVWRSVAPALASQASVHAWDMPGYGQSTMADDQDVRIETQARVFTDLVTDWGLDAPVVIAHDIGGAVALRAHLLHGMEMRRLVLVDVVAVGPWGSPFFRLVREHPDVFPRLPAHLHEALVRSYVTSASARGLSPETLDALVAPWLGPVGQAAFYRQIAQADPAATDEIEPLYGEVRTSVTLVWGTADGWIPVDRAERLARVLPGDVGIHRIEGAGHLVHEDAPAELAARLVELVGPWTEGRAGHA